MRLAGAEETARCSPESFSLPALLSDVIRFIIVVHCRSLSLSCHRWADAASVCQTQVTCPKASAPAMAP